MSGSGLVSPRAAHCLIDERCRQGRTGAILKPPTPNEFMVCYLDYPPDPVAEANEP